MKTLDEKSPAWHAEAACLKHPKPDMWFPSMGEVGEYAAARRTCSTCPVRLACLAYAISNNEVWGIWGGLNRAERANLAGRK